MWWLFWSFLLVVILLFVVVVCMSFSHVIVVGVWLFFSMITVGMCVKSCLLSSLSVWVELTFVLGGIFHKIWVFASFWHKILVLVCVSFSVVGGFWHFSSKFFRTKWSLVASVSACKYYVVLKYLLAFGLWGVLTIRWL